MITKRDAHKNFKLLMDKSASGAEFGGCPAFLTEEIDKFLDQAVLEVISNKYSGTQNNMGFDQTEKRMADLQSLIGSALITASSDSKIKTTVKDCYVEINNRTFQLPCDFMFYVDSIIKVQLKSDSEEPVYSIRPVKLVSHEVAHNFIETDLNKPYIPQPVCTLDKDRITIYFDTYDIDRIVVLQLNYIFTPTRFADLKPNDEISDLSDAIINEVINRAVIIALENIESQRVNTKAQLNGIQE